MHKTDSSSFQRPSAVKGWVLLKYDNFTFRRELISFPLGSVVTYSECNHHVVFIFFLKGENDVFGDNICHEPTVGQSAVDVFALTYCDLHWIQRDALIEVLEFYPDFANKFTKNLVLSYNLRDEVRV